MILRKIIQVRATPYRSRHRRLPPRVPPRLPTPSWDAITTTRRFPATPCSSAPTARLTSIGDTPPPTLPCPRGISPSDGKATSLSTKVNTRSLRTPPMEYRSEEHTSELQSL